jgi:hypothetical protein
MRGHKRDEPLTKMLRENGLLLDAHSFVGYDLQMQPHILLKGPDIILQREAVLIKSRNRCAGCKRVLLPGEEELDHIQGGLSGRCDCRHNLQILCFDCHRKKHVRVKFGGSNANRRASTTPNGHEAND